MKMVVVEKQWAVAENDFFVFVCRFLFLLPFTENETRARFFSPK